MLKRLISRFLPILKLFTVKRVVGLLGLLLAIGALFTVLIMMTNNVAVFNPKGVIAQHQMDLIIFTTLLGMVVIIPVFIMMFTFAWRYREGNKKRKALYTPDADGSRLLEAIWWGVPIAIIAILGVVTWISTHQLDPYKQVAGDKKPITIQVIALEWKWLFIYPEQNLATLGEVRFPEKTPVNFEVTADAPMSAFWIPNLGSQIYAMKGMTTKLSLMADGIDEYRGVNTNINGEGYSDMTFRAKSVSDTDFTNWVQAKASSPILDWDGYQAMVKPSKNDPIATYQIADSLSFSRVVNQYMSHSSGNSHSAHDMMESMEEK